MAEQEKPPVRVVIVDIDIPFVSLAWLIAKLIPAIVIGSALVFGLVRIAAFVLSGGQFTWPAW